MISCRIVLNELPDNVIDSVLCVDEVDEDDGQWRLLDSTKTSRVFRFLSKPGAPAWLIRWGFDYSWSHFKDAFLGRDHATRDWQKTTEAERNGIPVVRYRLLGIPRLITASLDTLLVTEFIEHSTSAANFMKRHGGNGLLEEDFLIQLGELLAQIHRRGFVHGSFSLDHIVIQYDDPTRLTVTNWYNSRRPNEEEPELFRDDLLDMLASLSKVGVQPGQVETFFNAYCTRKKWARERFGELFLQAVGKEPSR